MVYLQETGKLKSIFFTIVWFVDVSKTAIDAGVDLSIVQVDVNFSHYEYKKIVRYPMNFYLAGI